MKHAWTILCQKAIIDQSLNTISLIDSFEELTRTSKTKITTKTVQTLPVNFEIVSLWYDNDPKKESKGILKVELYDPANKKLCDFADYKFSVPKRFKRMRTRIKVNGLPFSKPGNYKLKIKYKGSQQTKYTLATELPLEVRI